MKEDQVKEDQQSGSDELFERFVIKIDKGQNRCALIIFNAAYRRGEQEIKIRQAINAGMVTVNKNAVKRTIKERV